MARRRRSPFTSVGAAIGLTASALVLGGGAPVGLGDEAAVAQEPGAPGLLPVPSPLPVGAPGDLIDSAPFAPGDFPFTVEPHQILFHSTDRTGADIAVSGLVLVPVGVPAPVGGRSVVAWAHGTTGMVDGCAPSLDAQRGGRLNSTQSYDRIDDLLAAGHIVVASDYPGLGTPGVHPYLDGLSEGRSVLDSIRAARPFRRQRCRHHRRLLPGEPGRHLRRPGADRLRPRDRPPGGGGHRHAEPLRAGVRGP